MTQDPNAPNNEQIAQGGKVEMDQATYDAMIERVAVLEESENKSHQTKSPVDALADEGTEGKTGEKPGVEIPSDIDNLSNSQLLTLIVDVVNDQAGNRLLNVEERIATMSILREIDIAARDHDDFWQYEDKVTEISTQNPTLSIEDAYKLAKSQSPKQEPPKDGDPKEPRQTKTERLLNLPPRGGFGEKPGTPISTTEKVVTGDRRQAIEQAWDDVIGKDKTQIE